MCDCIPLRVLQIRLLVPVSSATGLLISLLFSPLRILRLASAPIKVDGVVRPEWSFHLFPLPDGYAVCVARGPPSACSRSGQAAGVISDPTVGNDVLAAGHALSPQLRFSKVTLTDMIPSDAMEALQMHTTAV